MATSVNRVIFNILVRDLTTSAAFYRQLVGFEQTYTSSWYIAMVLPGVDGFQLGLIDEVSEFAPRAAFGPNQGQYLQLAVDNVFETLDRARALGVEIVDEPTALPFGQTRALIRDPNGLMIDLSTPTDDLVNALDRGLTPAFEDASVDQQQP
jgi:catechol 2,3-dioxygenase-like lactoylglutathione lyase family enzyme